MEEKFKKRKEDIGITKKTYKEGYFKEFDMYDMYKVNGKRDKSWQKNLLNCVYKTQD